jgi:hypothetical protein
MTENFEPVAQVPEPAPVSPATVSAKRRSASLWAGLAAAVLVAGGGGYVVGQNVSHGDRIDQVSFNGKMPKDGHGKRGGNGQMGPGGNGQKGPGMGPHCENTAGDHTAVNADGSCPTGYTLDDRGGMGGNQMQPNPEPSTTP